MFECERCGSSYSARDAVKIGDCPRCESEDKVASPLAFRPFSRIEPRRAPSAEMVRTEMTAGRLPS